MLELGKKAEQQSLAKYGLGSWPKLTCEKSLQNLVWLLKRGSWGRARETMARPPQPWPMRLAIAGAVLIILGAFILNSQDQAIDNPMIQESLQSLKRLVLVVK